MTTQNEIDQTETFEELLPVLLTDEERLERGEDLAGCLEVLDDIDAELRKAKAKAKADREPVEQQITELRRQLRTGTEYRDVQCYAERDFGEGVVRTIRVDTGEQVRVREMLEAERQAELPGASAPPPAPGRPGESHD